MTDMLNYSLAMLEAVGIFLRSEPMIYLFGFILLAIIVKIFLSFIPR